MRRRQSAEHAGRRLLVVDAGHSRIKYHLYQPGQAPLHLALPLKPLDWPADSGFARFDECLLMGTNERMHVRISSHLRQQGWPAPMLLGRDVAVPVPCDPPSGTGNDRLANALGAAREFKNESLLLVSAGSALVVDLIDDTGRLQGGLISLGLNHHLEAMAGLSAKLVWDGRDEGTYPAHDTPTAVYQGWLQPALACLENLQKSRHLEHMVLTGGDADRLAAYLPHAKVRPHLGADAMAQSLGYG